MKLKVGDRVRVIQKQHPWRRLSKYAKVGSTGTVVARLYVPKSREVPNGIIIVVQIGTKLKERFPTRYLEKIDD